MDVGEVPGHGPQNLGRKDGFALLVDLELAIVGSKPPHDDAAFRSVNRIGRAIASVRGVAGPNGGVRRTACEVPCRCHQRFRFMYDAFVVPAISHGDPARPAEASDAGLTPSSSKIRAVTRQTGR